MVVHPVPTRRPRPELPAGSPAVFEEPEGAQLEGRRSPASSAGPSRSACGDGEASGTGAGDGDGAGIGTDGVAAVSPASAVTEKLNAEAARSFVGAAGPDRVLA